MNFPRTIKCFLLLSLFTLAMNVGTVPLVQAQETTYSIRPAWEVSNKVPSVGDRIEVRMKAETNERKPLLIEKKAKFGIKNPKQGQECVTTDNSLSDGVISGYCEAKSESGNMEIEALLEENSNFTYEDKKYTPYIYEKYNVAFLNPQEACPAGSQVPHSLTLRAQNAMTVDVAWQVTDKFKGAFEVMYGETLGEYPNRRKLEGTTLVVDGLNPDKLYYFKVVATGACNTITTLGPVKYAPGTGMTSAVSEKSTATPSPKGSPVLTVKTSPKPTMIATSTATLTPSPVATPIALAPTPSPEPEVSTMPEKNSFLPIALAILSVGSLLAAGVAWRMKQRTTVSKLEGDENEKDEEIKEKDVLDKQ